MKAMQQAVGLRRALGTPGARPAHEHGLSAGAVSGGHKAGKKKRGEVGLLQCPRASKRESQVLHDLELTLRRGEW